MPKRDDDAPVPFTLGHVASDAQPTKPRGKAGPAPDPDALHAQLKDGRGAHLHAVIPAELHQRLKVRSVMTGATLSHMVAEAVAAYLEAAKPKT